MGLWEHIKLFFSRADVKDLSDDVSNLSTKLMLLHVSQQSQALMVSNLIANRKEVEALEKDLNATKTLIANAIQNLDDKNTNLEKLIEFVYEKLVDHEKSLLSLDERMIKNEFDSLGISANSKSPEN